MPVEFPEIREIGASSPARSIGGAKLVAGLLVAPVIGCVVAVLVLMIVATDSDKYGRVAVPGEAVLGLEAGTAHVFYSENTSLGADSTLHEPELDIAVVPAGGGSRLELEDSSTGINIDGLGSGAVTSIGSVEVEVAGRYRVAASGAEALERNTPEVTLGTNPGGELSDTALGLLFSPWTLAYLALVWLISSALTRRR